MFKNRLFTRQYIMAGIVLVFVLTMILGNYGIYTYINYERYVVKEALMDDIKDNVDRLSQTMAVQEERLYFFKSWIESQFTDAHPHSIIENQRMAMMDYDEGLERTYNSEVVTDNVGILMLYKGLLKDMNSDLRVEMNILFESYPELKFLYDELIPGSKLVLNSSYGYTKVLPYDINIDGNNRSRIVEYYEKFNNLSTASLDVWTLSRIPSDEKLYFTKTLVLEGGGSDQYFVTLLVPVDKLSSGLHSFEKNYSFHTIDGNGNLVLKNFQSELEIHSATDMGNLFEEELIMGQAYPFMKKNKDNYIVGHPVKGSDWNALAVFDESALGKKILFKTSGFYLLNILFVVIFSYLVVMVNRHLTEQEK